MKILFLTKEVPYPANNGHRIRSLNILKALAKNHKVFLVCFGKYEKDGENAEALKDICQTHFVPEKDVTNVFYKYWMAFCSLFSFLPYSIKLRFSIDMKQAVARIAEDEDVDLIVCDGIHQAAHVPDGRWKKLLSEHNVESVIVNRYYQVEKNPFKRFMAKREWKKLHNYEDLIWNKFDEIHVCSSHDSLEVTVRTHDIKIGVIPNGVDTEFCVPGDVPKKPNSIIYTGIMNWRPNQDAVTYFAKEIYPLIKKEIPDATFWIVGNKPTQAIKDLALHDPSITVTGFVEDIRPYVQQSEVVVVPLRIGSGTRLKILEAWAMEKNIVSTTIGCEGLDVIHQENILIADAPQIFAMCVVDVLKKKLDKDLGKNGRALVEAQYSWDKVTEVINQVIDSIEV